MNSAFSTWWGLTNLFRWIWSINLPLLLFFFSCKSETKTINWSKIPSPPNNPITIEGVALGKNLFSEPGISGNGKVSCATCHPPEGYFTTSQIFSKRAIPTLFNLAWADVYFWDGSHKNLESLVFRPIFDSTEMHGNLSEFIKKVERNPDWKNQFQKAFGSDSIYPALISRAISQFIRTLVKIMPDPDSLSLSEKKGFLVFQSTCRGCHSGIFGTDFKVRKSVTAASGKDFGAYLITHSLKDSFSFKTPTLVNISKTGPYMHDNRYKDLQTVVSQYSKKIKNSEIKSIENQQNLILFLKKL